MFIKKLHFLFFIISLLGFSQTQEIIMLPNNNSPGFEVVYVTCDANFYDSGGINEPYGYGENGIVTFCPQIETDRSQIFFSLLDLQGTHFIRVYDGDTDSAPLISEFSNTFYNTLGYTVTASQQNSSGCLTVTFDTPDSGYPIQPYEGWEAQVSCVDPCQEITTSVSTYPGSVNNILRACPGEDITFQGEVSFSSSDIDASFQWNFGDGSELVEGLSVTHSYSDPGIYLVNFTAIDYMGCKDRNRYEVIVQISPDPEIDLSITGDNPICLGDTTQLSVSTTPQNFGISYPSQVDELVAIPLGVNFAATSCIDLDLFPEDAILSSANDIESISVNIEHSALNQLELRLTAPNGASVDLIAYPSETGYVLGEPLDDGTNNPGLGYTYTFSENALQTINDYAIGGGSNTIPAGDYKPSTSFSNLMDTPLNGQWCIEVLDHVSANNGFVFNWKLNFNESLIPPQLYFETQVESQNWVSDPAILTSNENTITIQPQNYGENCYTYKVVDDAGCVYSETICVNVHDEIPINQPNAIVQCSIGTTVFDLTIRESQLLEGLNPSDYNISYHLTQNDAEIGANPIANSSAYITNQASQTIYIAVESVLTSCIQVAELELFPEGPVININNSIDICNSSDSNTFTVDLTAFTSTILGNQSSSEFSVNYYTSQLDAEANTNSIITPEVYQSSTNPETIYVRLASIIDPSCFTVDSFTIEALPFPELGTPTDMYVCDDVSNDGIEVFDFDNQIGQILGDINPNTLSITFHGSLNDAEQNQNDIGTIYTNTAISEEIYVRVENIVYNDCFQIFNFTVNVEPHIELGIPNDLYENDDVSGDGIEIFDLTLNNTLLLNGLSTNQYEITFYSSYVDAETASNPLNSQYVNTNSPETIFVRVESDNANCFEVSSFELYINNIPEITTVSALNSCDDDADGFTSFSLEDRIDEIVNGQNNVSVQFFETTLDRDANTNSLNTTNYTNSVNPQTIYYRLTNTSTGAYAYGEMTIEAFLAPEITNNIELSFCDSGSGEISLNLNTFNQLFTQEQSYSVNYFETLNDAETTTNNLNTEYTLTSDSLLFVRIENPDTACYAIGQLQLNFNTIEASTLLPVYTICLDADGSLINGPAVLDTGLNSSENTFQWYYEDSIITNETSNYLTAEQSGNYAVFIENIQSGCQFTINTSVNYSSLSEEYDVSIQSDAFANNAIILASATGPGNYLFSLDDGQFTASGLFSNVSPGLHHVTIQEANGCGLIEVPVYVVGYPKFFTPNNDGFNDLWHIQGKETLQNIKLYIYDRYGKLLKELNSNSLGWDGTFKNKPLPTNDYWFTMYFEYQGQKQQISGHFTLKR